MKTTCPICDNNNCIELLPLSRQPLSRYGLSKTKKESVKVNVYPVHIFHCNCCQFIFNNDFDSSNVDYCSDEIEESSIFSEGIRKYMDKNVSFLSKALDLNKKTILEVGCGDGYFISSFKNSTLVAYEPSPEGHMAKSLGVNVFHEYLTPKSLEEYTHKKPYLIIMRQVLEHISNPLSFLKLLEKFSDNNSKSYIYIEVPNSYLSVNNARFYDFYYEHVNYFNISSLSCMLNKAGYRVIKCSEEHSGEVVRVLAELPSKNKKDFKLLGDNIGKKAKYILDKRKSGSKIVGWGASGNGPSFLNYNNLGCNIISYVVDSDVRKQGKYIPITSQKVYPPSQLLIEKPNIVIIFSQFHKKDIESEINSLFGKGHKVEIIIL